MQKILFLLLLYLFYNTTLYASIPLKPINLSLSHHAIGKSVLVYEDSSDSMELTDIMQLPISAYDLVDKPVASHGFSNASFWYQFKVENNENALRSRLIIFEPGWLDHITLTIVSPQGEIKSYKGGNTLPYDIRAIDHYLINFKHSFEPGLSTVYAQVKTRDPFIVSISVMEESTFLLQENEHSLWIGLIYGGIIAMLLYNLFLYFGIKKRYYAFYVLYLSSFVVMNASYNGYTFMTLLSEYPEVHNWSISVSIYFFVLSSLFFARSFLNLKNHHARLYTMTTNLIYTVIIVSVLSALIGGYQYHVFSSIVFVMIKSSYIVVIALYSFMKGNRSARFFLLGATSGLIGAFVTALTVMSFIPYTYFTYKANDFGMFIDVVLLSMALAERMKITQEKKIIAEKEAKTDILTGLLNRRAYYEISNSEHKKLLRYHRDFSIIMLDIDDFKAVNDTYGHQAGDRVLKNVASTIKKSLRESDFAFRMGGDEFIILLPETNAERAYHLADRIRSKIEDIKLKKHTRRLSIGSSMGISEFKKDDANLEVVLKRADEALYRVKNSSKNKVEIWKP